MDKILIKVTYHYDIDTTVVFCSKQMTIREQISHIFQDKEHSITHGLGVAV
jgi:hypothetical protein